MEYSETEKQMLREILPGIATQLRGSLANIHAALGRLAPEQARDASTDTDRSAAILCQSYYRILRVVNNLSDAPMLAEEKPLDTENVELVRFLDGLCRQGEALAQLMELRLTFTCPERAHTVAVNREYLARLFWNLVSNAMKFTEPGGHISLQLKKTSPKRVCLIVRDDGCGIASDQMGMVFSRQESPRDLPDHRWGIGLGLPLTRAILQQHGGSVILESQPGYGTTVYLALPCTHSYSEEPLHSPVHHPTPFSGFSPALVELADVLPSRIYDFEDLDG